MNNAASFKMYYTVDYMDIIDIVFVTRKSESSVWIMYLGRERRESRSRYFDTFEDAKQSLIDSVSKKIEYCDREMVILKNRLERLSNLKSDI